MVVQQNSDVKIWGWADPDTDVSAYASWNQDNVVHTTADATTGYWLLELKTPEATFLPQQLVIENRGDKKIINNVLIGEVWFCSGQSNMEMPLRGFWTQPVEGAAEAIAYSGYYPGIRVAKVPKRISYTPQDRVESPWMVSCPKNAYNFSALAYFFAQSLTK